MRRILAWSALCLFLAAAAWPAPRAVAQQDDTEPVRKAQAFIDLWRRLEKTQDPAERVAWSDEALKLVGELDPWPLSLGREHALGHLWMWSGLGYAERQGAEREEDLERAIDLYERAAKAFTREGAPVTWAWAREALGSAYQNRIRGNRADNLERSIEHFEAVLTVRTREAMPRDWAVTKDNLGIVYAGRLRGDREENLEKAIAAHEEALSVRTREAMPQDWAWTLHNLAGVFKDRIRGNRGDNQEKAIALYEAALAVRTREALPLDWAMTRHGLATVYGGRIQGDRGENVEKAIEHLEAALSAYSPAGQPREWADVQRSLGLAFGLRARGERADNAEKAIAAFEMALTVLNQEAYPQDWAQVKTALALLYLYRVRGQRADNLEGAILHLQDALKVVTREASPEVWAQTQINLGFAYADRLAGKRTENLDQAIRHFEAALSTLTREAAPRFWAVGKMSLGNALRNRAGGDLDAAIGHYEAALTVFTHEAFPLEWSLAQGHIGRSYLDTARGDRTAALAKAVGHLEAALSVQGQTPPRDMLGHLRALGAALSEKGEWHRASAVYAEARETFLLLSAQGLDDTAAAALIDSAGPLFAEAAYAAARLGNAEKALELANEGRARLLAAALHLQSLDLPDKRQRLDELRADIRAAERMVESQTTQGTERAAAVERLVALRKELVALVKDADAAAAKVRGSALARARALTGKGGAVAVPIVTRLGGQILIVGVGSSRSAAVTRSKKRSSNGSGVATAPDPEGVVIIDMPELTTAALGALVLGTGSDDGWIRGYAVNLLANEDLRQQGWPIWMAAIEGLGPDLWRLVGARLDAGLKRAGTKAGARLVWLPTGALGILPLGLAQNPTSKRRLMDDHEIVYAPSLDALAAAQDRIARSPPATLAAVVNPTGDLPAAEQEGRAVASHFPARARAVLEGAAATPEAVLAALKGRSYWHFASHGSFEWNDARRSALIMHDNKPLSVGRLLETGVLSPPRLVVLSACETGLYDTFRNPAEFVGLPGTFTALGAAGVLGTLWPVNDMATALLLAKFYDLHLVGRLPPPTALRRAQLWLRQATSADLLAYARGTARQGRLDARHVAAITEGAGRRRTAPRASRADGELRGTRRRGHTGAAQRGRSRPSLCASVLLGGVYPYGAVVRRSVVVIATPG